MIPGDRAPASGACATTPGDRAMGLDVRAMVPDGTTTGTERHTALGRVVFAGGGSDSVRGASVPRGEGRARRVGRSGLGLAAAHAPREGMRTRRTGPSADRALSRLRRGRRSRRPQ